MQTFLQIWFIVFWVMNMHYKRIRDLRGNNDLTQQELANYLHGSQSVYSRYELGKQELPVYMLMRLAIFYNTSTNYLVGLTDCKEKRHT